MTDTDIVTGLRTDAALFGKMPPHAKVNMNPEFMREMSQLWIAAANEIERLREELTASHESHGNEVGALTERLSLAIHERDEARREVCGLLVACHTDPDDEKPDPNLKNVHAGIRGWDCFKENTNG